MGELRSDQQRQQPQPPLPSAPQAVLSVMVEPYAPLPYDHHRHHQQSPAADQCYGEHYRQQQINIPNALAYGAPATPYPGHPRQMVTNSTVTDHCPVGEDKHSDVDRLPFCGLGIGWLL
ncbi:unnamed protein product [Linum trigynum]|uniref:Uncharacterized protein n=1 Tax=Linum trigynum TaxID=586398 RepID=A0AAV2EKK0_9ROSI